MRRTARRQDPMHGAPRSAGPPGRSSRKAAEPPPVEPAGRKAQVSKARRSAAGEPAGRGRRSRAGSRGRAGRCPEVRTVTGHVRDPQGRPLAGVQLQAALDPLRPGRRPQDFDLPATDREGLFIFPDLPRRPLKITLTRRRLPISVGGSPGRSRSRSNGPSASCPTSSAKDQPAPAEDEPIPPGLRDRLTFVDLEPRGTDYLADGPGGSRQRPEPPAARHPQAGRDVFPHRREDGPPPGPDAARPAPGGQGDQGPGPRAGCCTSCTRPRDGATRDKLIGAYVIHYADGSSERIPLVYGRDITNWWHRDPGRRSRPGPRSPGPARTTCTEHTDPGLKIRLFDMAWTNPHPGEGDRDPRRPLGRQGMRPVPGGR